MTKVSRKAAKAVNAAKLASLHNLLNEAAEAAQAAHFAAYSALIAAPVGDLPTFKVSDWEMLNQLEADACVLRHNLRCFANAIASR